MSIGTLSGCLIWGQNFRVGLKNVFLGEPVEKIVKNGIIYKEKI